MSSKGKQEVEEESWESDLPNNPKRKLQRRLSRKGKQAVEEESSPDSDVPKNPKRKLRRRMSRKGKQVVEEESSSDSDVSINPKRKLRRRMSRKGKQVVEEESSSDSDVPINPKRKLRRDAADKYQHSDYDGPKNPKKKPERDPARPDDEIVICELSKSRRVSVRRYDETICVDIRNFYMKRGEQIPTNIGISLLVDEWEKLWFHADEVDQILKKFLQ